MISQSFQPTFCILSRNRFLPCRIFCFHPLYSIIRAYNRIIRTFDYIIISSNHIISAYDYRIVSASRRKSAGCSSFFCLGKVTSLQAGFALYSGKLIPLFISPIAAFLAYMALSFICIRWLQLLSVLMNSFRESHDVSLSMSASPPRIASNAEE